MRHQRLYDRRLHAHIFPFLLGGTFIEALKSAEPTDVKTKFPFLLGGTFIEAELSESLKLRMIISLPFGRDFH